MKHPGIDGIIPPLVTPLTQRSGLDRNALEGLIEHVIAGGVHGIFLLGSTGEGPSLSFKMRSEVIRAGIRIAAGRIPVYTNVTSASFPEVIQLLQQASNEGADAAVLAPPYYFPMNQRELIRFYTQVADGASIPLLLYNAPQYTKTELEPETVQVLVQHERIAGLKDSSGNMNYIHALLKAREVADFKILVGPELLLVESLLSGCNGGICGGANLYPALYVKLFESVAGNKESELRQIQGFLEKINDTIFTLADAPMSIVQGIKTMLSLKGICSNQMAMPVYGDFSDDRKRSMEKLDKEIESCGF